MPNVMEYDSSENRDFWETIKRFLLLNLNVGVDILSGDLNMVEEAMDRSPMRADPQEAIKALGSLKQVLGIKNE